MENYYSFVGGTEGRWRVVSNTAVVGQPLEAVQRIEMINLPAAGVAQHGSWILQGFTSNIRYAERSEMIKLRSKQEGLNRPGSLCAALIPIKKSDAWWELTQEERRAIFEEQSHHTEIALEYLPRIARQLHHCRDLGEPFDFLTWFEFAPEHISDFNKLLEKLRATKEWCYVEREIDIRIERNHNE